MSDEIHEHALNSDLSLRVVSSHGDGSFDLSKLYGTEESVATILILDPPKGEDEAAFYDFLRDESTRESLLELVHTYAGSSEAESLGVQPPLVYTVTWKRRGWLDAILDAILFPVSPQRSTGDRWLPFRGMSFEFTLEHLFVPYLAMAKLYDDSSPPEYPVSQALLRLRAIYERGIRHRGIRSALEHFYRSVQLLERHLEVYSQNLTEKEKSNTSLALEKRWQKAVNLHEAARAAPRLNEDLRRYLPELTREEAILAIVLLAEIGGQFTHGGGSRVFDALLHSLLWWHEGSTDSPAGWYVYASEEEKQVSLSRFFRERKSLYHALNLTFYFRVANRSLIAQLDSDWTQAGQLYERALDLLRADPGENSRSFQFKIQLNRERCALHGTASRLLEYAARADAKPDGITGWLRLPEDRLDHALEDAKENLRLAEDREMPRGRCRITEVMLTTWTSRSPERAEVYAFLAHITENMESRDNTETAAGEVGDPFTNLFACLALAVAKTWTMRSGTDDHRGALAETLRAQLGELGYASKDFEEHILRCISSPSHKIKRYEYPLAASYYLLAAESEERRMRLWRWFLSVDEDGQVAPYEVLASYFGDKPQLSTNDARSGILGAIDLKVQLAMLGSLDATLVSPIAGEEEAQVARLHEARSLVCDRIEGLQVWWPDAGQDKLTKLVRNSDERLSLVEAVNLIFCLPY